MESSSIFAISEPVRAVIEAHSPPVFELKIRFWKENSNKEYKMFCAWIQSALTCEVDGD